MSRNSKPLPKELQAILDSAPKKPLPKSVKPMLATLVDKPFDDSEWSFEIKWDGYRALALLNEGEVNLTSRNEKSFNAKFYSVFDALKKWNVNAVIDGEIIVTNSQGISSFGALQNWRSEADGLLIFYAFDLLWLEGKDLTKLGLTVRRSLLRSVIPKDSQVIRLSENFEGSGIKVFEEALRLGLEGIIAKRNASVYRPGDRSSDWLKIKAHKRQEVVIGGYTKNEGSTKPFSSLLVGVFDGGELKYTGKIGTGFDTKTQRAMLEQFKPLVRATSPFSTIPDINSPSRFRPNPPKATATWLEPKLVCEVSFTEMTSDEVMRHPSFEGMRADKKAADVVLEREQSAAALADSKSQGLLEDRKDSYEGCPRNDGRNQSLPLQVGGGLEGVPGSGQPTPHIHPLNCDALLVPATSMERKTLLNPTEASQVRKIDGHDLKFGNLQKLYWPEDNISKRDLLNYYYQVAPYILPYLKDRPQSLNRHPNGIHGKQFYQKDVKGKVPDWVHTFPYYSEGDRREKEFFICDDEASLLYLVSLGCIEISPWSSRAASPDMPDWCVIDLDPDQNSFDEVIAVAQGIHKLLEHLGVPSCPKTSGSTGLHIYIPLGAKYTYEESKEFARALVTVVHAEFPKSTSIERQVEDRQGKMYLDFLQNRPQATIAAPYCVRPKPGAPVSMPLHWDEVRKGLRMTDFTIHNAISRIKSVGDIFTPVLGDGIDLEETVKKLHPLR